MHLHLVPTADLGATAAALVVDGIRDGIERRGLATVALSGGTTPVPMYEALAGADVPWPRVHVFQVDERIAPEGTDARNLTALRRHLLDHVPAVAHPMPVDAPDLSVASAAYEAEITEWSAGSLDVIHLGLGEDGHTASLFPEDPVLEVHERTVALTEAHAGHRRMTMTFPMIDRAWVRVWLVSGEAKRGALADLLDDSGPARTPAALTPRDHTEVVTDLTGV